VDLSIVIPAYNEEARVVETVNSVCDFLASRDWQSEVIVVDDGSIDATAQRVQAACETQPNLRLVTAQVNRGKGAAIRLGAGQARGDIIGFIDADDKTDIAGLDRVFTSLADGAHVVIGDRTLADTAIHIQRRGARFCFAASCDGGLAWATFRTRSADSNSTKQVFCGHCTSPLVSTATCSMLSYYCLPVVGDIELIALV
jgi:glycosyltransferase involved in cell wall biosynthesis